MTSKSPSETIFFNALSEKEICQIKICGRKGGGHQSSEIILLNLSQGTKLGQYHFTNKMARRAGIPACRPSHITNPLLIKQTLLLSYFLAPTDCFPFRFSVVHISISRFCILLLLLLKYCFFFKKKISFNQIAPAGMSCQRYSFQWTLALCCITLATRFRGEGPALNLSESPRHELSTCYSQAYQVVMPTTNNKTHLSLLGF